MSVVRTELTDKSTERAGKYLTFGLGKEEYGLAILKVREIIGYMDITPVPRTPLHVKGVINLRGQVIPVLDLRAKFEMPSAERTQATCVIVVETVQEERRISTGIVVDRVCEVVNIASAAIQDAPNVSDPETPQYILGIGQIGNSIKILLDIDQVLKDSSTASLIQSVN